ncbi:hypothetical protein BH11MYX1_BH11MYX1_19020 [soil metagenome]
MRMASSIAVVASGLVASFAHADHLHEMGMDQREDAPAFAGQVSLVAAAYATPSYVGDYQGVVPSLAWAHDRYLAGASLGLYRIMLNGLQQHGIGDLMVHAGATFVRQHDVRAGVMMMVSAPTADSRFGLGMGHAMLMPSLFGAWTRDRLTVQADAGYSRALAKVEAGHDHGVWPLVEPMNMSEITWGAGCELALGDGLRGGARLTGGVPLGPIRGHDRVIGALRVGWGRGRVDTAAEVQAGLVGDPFTVRGLLESALHF